jgi:hypothetical protein
MSTVILTQLRLICESAELDRIVGIGCCVPCSLFEMGGCEQTGKWGSQIGWSTGQLYPVRGDYSLPRLGMWPGSFSLVLVKVFVVVMAGLLNQSICRHCTISDMA